MANVTEYREYSPKDFLTFLFCGGNWIVLQEIQSQLQQKGLEIELNACDISVRIIFPLIQNASLDATAIQNEIQTCILNIQGLLKFEELEWPVAGLILQDLLNSSAKRNYLLQMQIQEKVDQNRQIECQYLWLVYSKSCNEEIARCKNLNVQVVPKPGFIQHTVTMSHEEAHILERCGVLQAARQCVLCPVDIKISGAGLELYVQSDSDLKHLLDFISSFQRSVIKSDEQVNVLQLIVLLQPKVIEGLQNAIASLPVYFEIDMQISPVFHFFSRTEDDAAKAIFIIKQLLTEMVIPLSEKHMPAQTHENWTKFIESVRDYAEKNDFIIRQNECTLTVTGLKDSVTNVVNHIDHLTQIHSEDVEMHDDAVRETTDTRPVTEDFSVDSKEFHYIQRFPELFDNICVKTSDAQEFVLTGSALQVQKVRKEMNKITTEELEVENSEFISTGIGIKYLKDEVEKNCQVLLDPLKKQRNQSRNTERNFNKGNSQHTWYSENKYGLYKWKIDKKCEVSISLAEVESLGAEVVLETVDKRKDNSEYI